MASSSQALLHLTGRESRAGSYHRTQDRRGGGRRRQAAETRNDGLFALLENVVASSSFPGRPTGSLAVLKSPRFSARCSCGCCCGSCTVRRLRWGERGSAVVHKGKGISASRPLNGEGWRSPSEEKRDRRRVKSKKARPHGRLWRRPHRVQWGLLPPK